MGTFTRTGIRIKSSYHSSRLEKYVQVIWRVQFGTPIKSKSRSWARGSIRQTPLDDLKSILKLTVMICKWMYISGKKLLVSMEKVVSGIVVNVVKWRGRSQKEARVLQVIRIGEEWTTTWHREFRYPTKWSVLESTTRVDQKLPLVRYSVKCYKHLTSSRCFSTYSDDDINIRNKLIIVEIGFLFSLFSSPLKRRKAELVL